MRRRIIKPPERIRNPNKKPPLTAVYKSWLGLACDYRAENIDDFVKLATTIESFRQITC